MSDLDLDWRGDLSIDLRGDLRLVAGDAAVRQRIVRRLLTVPAGYVWHPAYGAGLGQHVGQPVDLRAIEAKVRQQLRRENGVARQPEPEVAGGDGASTATGVFPLLIRYNSAATAERGTVQFDLGA